MTLTFDKFINELFYNDSFEKQDGMYINTVNNSTGTIKICKPYRIKMVAFCIGFQFEEIQRSLLWDASDISRKFNLKLFLVSLN